MIFRFFEVRCDYCERVINLYPLKKPNNKILQRDCEVITSTKQFCSEICFAEYNHDLQVRRYLNLKQKGKINR